ncbi:MAG: AraC family transcriptional regulator [Niabella sp.]
MITNYFCARKGIFEGSLTSYECGSINYENGSIMGYEIMAADFSDFISSEDEINTSATGENTNHIKLHTPKGNIHYKEEILQGPISILEGHYHMQDDVTISGRGDAALLEIQFNLSDNTIAYQGKSGTEHVTPARSGNIVFLSAEENEARIFFRKDVSYNTFDIHLPVSLLNQYAGESRLMDNFITQIGRDTSSMLTQNTISISPAIYNTIQDIKTCAYDGLTRKIYMESKTYELIALIYENVKNQKSGTELSAADQDRIHLAASIIRDNLATPCTIIELAHKVGVNQTKLKTGFKSLFGKTVFDYLQDIRMHQAKRYLLDTQLSVQEIGLLLGYQNTSNFSMAFKKIHGFSPMKLRKNEGAAL